jgi:hypothetical protein
LNYQYVRYFIEIELIVKKTLNIFFILDGAKVLALRDGTVDLHGANVMRTWTRLASTAAAGATTITLLQPVDWPVGSEIVIATTGNYLSQGESETSIITAVSSNGLTLTLNSPLTYTHLGITQNVGSTSVEIRAEVGLLSHNVVFQGLFRIFICNYILCYVFFK